MTQKSSFKIVLACIIANIISSIVSLRIAKKYIPFVPFVIWIGLVVLYLIGMIIYIFVWKRKQEKLQTDQILTLVFWQNVIRYFIALDMVMFALQKFFHLQFIIPLGKLDDPFSSLSGEELIWAFYGKFYAFTAIIASLQLTCAVLLLFRRTHLLAVIVLLPLLFNIFLLDWFYNLGLVVNIYITLLLLATIYLLLTEYNRLKEFFFNAKTNEPIFIFKRSYIKNIVRLSAIAIPLLLITFYRFPESRTEIFGKYIVKNSTVHLPLGSVLFPGDTLTKVFFDNSDIVFDFGTYEKRFVGNCIYNKQNKQIIGIWRYPNSLHDTLYAKMLYSTNRSSQMLIGTMGKKKFSIKMQKVD